MTTRRRRSSRSPALDAFTDLAAELTTTAEREAHENGRWLLSDRRAAA